MAKRFGTKIDSILDAVVDGLEGVLDAIEEVRGCDCGCDDDFEDDFVEDDGDCGCPRFAPTLPKFSMPQPSRCPEPRGWRVGGFPPEDKNKVFGVHIEVDEPRREDYGWDRCAFERDHAKFDRLVDAAEACDWENKSNTAPKTRVNAIRRRVEDGPVMGLNLVGETHWF